MCGPARPYPSFDEVEVEVVLIVSIPDLTDASGLAAGKLIHLRSISPQGHTFSSSTHRKSYFFPFCTSTLTYFSHFHI